MPLAVLVGDQFRDKDKRSGGRIVIVTGSPDRLGRTSFDPNPFYTVKTISSRNPYALGRRSEIRRSTLFERFVYLPKGSPSYIKTGDDE